MSRRPQLGAAGLEVPRGSHNAPRTDFDQLLLDTRSQRRVWRVVGSRERYMNARDRQTQYSYPVPASLEQQSAEILEAGMPTCEASTAYRLNDACVTTRFQLLSLASTPMSRPLGARGAFRCHGGAHRQGLLPRS
jgi:hypothetical protein